MIKGSRILVLTDHSGHSDQNSIYAILNQMMHHDMCHSIHVASRGLAENVYFFDGMQRHALLGCKVAEDFKFTEEGDYFKKGLKKLVPTDFDIVFMRLPRPISDDFLYWLDEVFSHAVVINKPKGIIATSNKKYLMNFPELCPDMRLCYSIEEIKQEVAKHPIVLKPLKEYGGRGLLRIESDFLDDGNNEFDTNLYLEAMKESIEEDGYLSMKYLKNVDQGDKRILVVDGQVLAASLRLPAKDSWLCNVSRGGTSVSTDITIEEKEIVEKINPSLRKRGIFMYGVDTLVNDEGKRVLSEINTLSIGGFPQAESQSGEPVICTLIDKIFKYADDQRK